MLAAESGAYEDRGQQVVKVVWREFLIVIHGRNVGFKKKLSELLENKSL